MKVQLLSDFPERIEPGKRAWLEDTEVEVEVVKWHQNRLQLKFKSIHDRTTAEKYIGANVFVENQPLDLEADEFFVSELVGLTVIDERSGKIGTVDDVLNAPAQDILVVGNVLIPFAKAFVTHIDRRKKEISVRLIDGMLEGETG